MNATQTRKIGKKVQLRGDLHKTLGDYYFHMNGLWCVIDAIDETDEDGEQVYQVKTGFGKNCKYFTVTETMIR